MEAINASTGASASTTTTTDPKGFFEISGLTSAVYFAKPLVSGDDWDLLPNIAEIYTDEIHVASNGSLTIDGSVSAAKNIVLIDLTDTATTGAVRGVMSDITSSGADNVTGVASYITKSAGGNATGLLSSVQSTLSSGTLSEVKAVEALAFITGSSGGTITSQFGGYFVSQAAGGSASVTSNYGILVGPDSGGTNNYGINITGPSSGANNYAIYSSATAQSVHAGNFRIGSTTAPTVALDVTGAILGSSTVTGTQFIATTGSVDVGLNSNGSIDLNADNTAGRTPFIDWHYSNTGNADYAARMIATGTTRLDLQWAGGSTGSIVFLQSGLGIAATPATNTLTLGDGIDIVVNATTGTKIGTATTQKLGFYNATPVVRPSAYTQTYSAADKTHANDGSADFPAGGTGTAAGGWDTAANRNLAITRFNALRVTVTDLKQLVNAVIDDLQALGLVG